MGNQQPEEMVQSRLLGDNRQQFKAHFLLNDKDIFQLLQVFVDFDVNNQGFLTMDDFINFVVEDNYTLILPCIVHLFRLIAKQQPDKLYFQQWLGSMISFCLYNKESLFRFIFQMIDTDYDDKIRYADLMQYLSFQDAKTNQKVFPSSFITSLQQAKINKDKYIFFEQFRKISENLKFLCWPAQHLQQNLRKKLLGVTFWQQLGLRIEQQQSKLKKMSNKDRLDQQKKKIKQQKIKKLFQTKKTIQTKFKKKMHLRNPGQVGSDTKLSFKTCIQDIQFKDIKTHNRRKSLFD